MSYILWSPHYRSMTEGFPTPQNRVENMRPAPPRLLRPMANVNMLNIPVYDIKKIEASFDIPEKNLRKVELHPREWDASMVISDGKGKERRGIPISNIISTDLVAESKGIFNKEERLIEIIYNGDNREDTIRIKLDDKYVEEFLKSIEALRQNSSDGVYWTYRSLSYQTGTGHRTTVDIYPLAPFLAEGEEIVWHNAGIVKKKIVWLQALTNYRVYWYDYVQHAGIFVLLPALQDVVVMNQKRASN
jgi:hypothetical protein